MIDSNALWVLAEFLGKSALLIALGIGFVQVFAKLAPEVKHTLLLRVFAVGLMIPLLWVLLPRWGVIPAVGDTAEEEVISIGTGEVFTEAPALVLSSEALPVAQVGSFPQPGWAELIFAVWCLGVIAFFWRSLIAARFLRRLEKEARPAAGNVGRKFIELRAGICPRSNVSLLASSKVQSAFTWGIFRPRIVMPEAVSGWPEIDMEMVLMHELEHVRRRDALAVLISRIFLALNWVNPLAWIAIRKTVQLREEACDRRVLRSGYPGQNYAEMLFRQASTVASPLWRTSATAVAETGTIERRIKMILNPETESDSGREGPSFANKVLPSAMMLIVLVVGMAGWAEGAKELSRDAETKEKLEATILPKVEFSDTPLSDALKFLQQRSVEIDPERKGIVILDTRKRGENFYDTRITLKLSNVPMMEVLRYTTSLAQLSFSIRDGAVVVEKVKPDPMRQSPSLGVNEKKLKEIMIPSVEFNETPLRDALAFLQMRSVELDMATKDPAEKGVNVIFDPEGGDTDALITMRLTNVPIGHAFFYVAELARASLNIEEHAVRIFFPKEGEKGNFNPLVREDDKDNLKALQAKLDEIVVPSLEFSNTPLSDALSFIQQRSAELDTATGEQGTKGINIILNSSREIDDVRISLKLTNVPLRDVLKYTATSAGGSLQIAARGVTVSIPEE